MRWVPFVVVVLLAGCAGSPEGTDGTGVRDLPPPSSGKGSISGVVVDETITPVAGALVSLQGVALNATANEEGQFAFEDLDPGAYFLKGSAYGHETTQASVEVLPGKVSKPRLMLPTVPVEEPYHQTYQRNTYNLMSAPVVIAYYGGEYVELDGPFETLVIDGAWKGDVFIVLEPDEAINTYVGSDPDGWSQSWNTPTQFSIRVDRPDGLPEGLKGLEWNSKPGFDSVSFQAKGEMFFTSFYNQAAPPEWSLHNGDA